MNEPRYISQIIPILEAKELVPINQVQQQLHSDDKALRMPYSVSKPDEQPSWLKEWRPSQAPSVNYDVIRQEIIAATAALEPAGVKIAAVMLERAVSHFGAPTNWADIAEDYLEELSQVPVALIGKIWPEIRRNNRFFPKIPELLAPIEDDWSNRKHKRLRLLAAAGALT